MTNPSPVGETILGIGGVGASPMLGYTMRDRMSPVGLKAPGKQGVRSRVLPLRPLIGRTIRASWK